MGFYDGTKLLSMKDINGNTPEIYGVSTNRSGGKTTFFNRLQVNRFIKKGLKFGVMYRYKYELENCAGKIFKDLKNLFFPDYEMTSKPIEKGSFCELFLNDIPCGYAFPLNSADNIKKNSHYFSDINSYIFDEFQSESGTYCQNEITKFISIHDSIARGNGKQHRYVPVYMLSNPVTILNPYYTAFGISTRLRADTKFIRGDGFVFEQGFVESASEELKESGFHKAFSNTKYTKHSEQGIYLLDNAAFIEKPTGRNKYYCTLKYKNNNYSVRIFESGFFYVGKRIDDSFPIKIAVTTEDFDINYVMLNTYDYIIKNMRNYFEHGMFRFADSECKEALMTAVSYY